MSEFFVGQKVVCVDDEAFTYEDGTYHVVPLRRGEEYTIRALEMVDFDDTGYSLGVKVVGVYRPEPDGASGDDFFGAMRFRPLESKSTQLFRDIAAGVTNGKPIVEDDEFDPALPTEAPCRFIHSFGGRPML